MPHRGSDHGDVREHIENLITIKQWVAVRVLAPISCEPLFGLENVNIIYNK